MKRLLKIFALLLFVVYSVPAQADKKICNCSNPSSEVDSIITSSLPTCCENEYGLVYDAYCKVLYRRKKNGHYEEVTDLKTLHLRYGKEFRVAVIRVNRYIQEVYLHVDDITFDSQPSEIWNKVFGGKPPDPATAAPGGGPAVAAPMARYTDHCILIHFKHDLDLFRRNLARADSIRLSVYTICPLTINDSCCGKDKRDGFFIRLNEQLNEQWWNLMALHNALLVSNDSCVKMEIELMAAVEADWKTLYESKVDEHLVALELFQRNYLKENTVFTTPPIYPNGNRININLKVEIPDTLWPVRQNIFPSEHHELSIDVPVYNKWFVSFASGPFVAFGKDLRPDKYILQPIPDAANIVTDSSKRRLVNTGSLSVPAGIGAFAHIQNQFSRCWSYGFSLGVGYSTDNQLSYLGGASLMFGEKKQLVLTAGVVGTNVKTLKKELYPDNVIYDPGVKQVPDFEYNTQFKAGGFIALSYTLFSTASSKNITSSSKKVVTP